MDPAFSSLRQAGAFAALLAFSLAAPLFLRSSHREAAWSSAPNNAGPFAWIEQQVFEEKGDIDILFIGSSFMWAGIDTPQVERALSRQLGRKATVITLGDNWWGEDQTYFLLRDLLARRKVTLAVFTLPTKTDLQSAPHPCASYWLDDAGAGLSLRHRLQLYAVEMLGTPRRLLGLLRPDRLEPSPYAAGLGAGRFREALPGHDFVRLHLPAPSLTAEELQDRARFHFDDVPLTPFQEHFFRLYLELARQHGVHLAVVHIPQRPTGAPSPLADERLDWTRLFGLPLVGVAPATLFAGMDRATIDAHYYNEHLNLNGAERLTRVLLPALLALHAQAR
jgi:hypothetical protein